MSELSFRTLRADEIDVRVGQQKPTGVALLLYKDARCDMSILDETIGPMNWMRSHSRENANCTVSIYDDEKQMWISKEDTGTESNTEAEKGLASDSFKRACVNWGIGRELYSAPFIWVQADKLTFKEINGKKYLQDRFSVREIEYDGFRRISRLVICSDKQKTPVYEYRQHGTCQTASPERRASMTALPPVPSSIPPKADDDRKLASLHVLEALNIDKEGFAILLNKLIADGKITKRPTDMAVDEYEAMCELMIKTFGQDHAEAAS